MGCVQCKDKEATKLTDERDGSLTQSSGYRYGTDPTPQHYPSFGVTSIPNYNNFHATGGQGLTVFGGVNSSSHTGTLRTRGGTGEFQSLVSVHLLSINHIIMPGSQLHALGKVTSLITAKIEAGVELGLHHYPCKLAGGSSLGGWEIMYTCPTDYFIPLSGNGKCGLSHLKWLRGNSWCRYVYVLFKTPLPIWNACIVCGHQTKRTANSTNWRNWCAHWLHKNTRISRRW